MLPTLSFCQASEAAIHMGVSFTGQLDTLDSDAAFRKKAATIISSAHQRCSTSPQMLWGSNRKETEMKCA